MQAFGREGLELITSAISDVIWIAASDLSQLQFVSPTYEQVWGRSSDSLRANPRSLLDAVHADDRERVERSIRERDGRAFELEYRIVHSDGTVRWIVERGHPVRDATGRVESYVCVARDVTEQKRIAGERDVAVERFELMQRAMREGMWDWDVAANKAWYSEQMYTVFGIDRSIHPSVEAWATRVHPDDRERVVSGFKRVVEQGLQTWSDEYRYVRPDGVVLEVYDRGFAMFDDMHRPVRLVGIVMDMTQQHALELQLRHAQKMEAVGQLAGGIAHDFNNMLQVVSLELALLQTAPDAKSKVLGHVAEIKAALERAKALTRQLLVFSRREAMQPRKIDLNAKVGELAGMLRRVLGEHISLELELAPRMLPIDVDPSMLDQVVLNLAVNARDAMPRGGTLAIGTSLSESVGRQGRAPGRYACITVRDTGVGIAPDILPRIFEPFFTTKEAEGTGLGLATAHGIIEQHRGWVEVESEVNRGTVFRVFLPALASGVMSPAAEPPVSSPRGKETILVVEDDAAIRRGLRALLESQGYEVVEADCGAAALAAWNQRDGRFDLVLTDLVMPGGMNGRELADQLSAMSPRIRIIFITGHGRDLEIGARHMVLQKPVDADRLLADIRAALDRD